MAFSTFTVLLLSVPSLVPFHPHTKALCAHRAGTKEGGPSCRLLAVLVTTNLPLSLDFPILDMSRVVAVRSLLVSDSAAPWTAARQASLSVTLSHSLLKLMSTDSVILPNHLILCCPLLHLLSVSSVIKVFNSELDLQFT